MESKLGFKSKSEFEEFCNNIQVIRDYLAHAQAPMKEMEWPKINELIEKTENITKILIDTL